MRRAYPLFLAIAVAFLAVPASASIVTLTAPMNGANERPGPGDPDGVGYALIRIDTVANTVTYSLATQGVTSPTLAHIHRGVAGIAGDIVVDLNPAFTNGAATGTVSAPANVIQEIVSNPGAFYVNVHNAQFPGGAVRGQLSTLATTATTMLSASMNGANERPNPGDPDGVGYALIRLDPNSNRVHYTLVIGDIAAPTMAHIHRGTADVAGDIVVDLMPTFVNSVASGVVTASPAIIAEILANPAGFYVNVHNAPFPAGAIRGQLANTSVGATEVVIPIAGRVAGANATFYRTDLTLLNRVSTPTQVLVEWYPAGNSNPAPAAIGSVVLEPNRQRNFTGDLLQTMLGTGNGTGALRIIATNPIHAMARIYNDQRPLGDGTFSQFVNGMTAEANRTSGILPMLSNQTAASGEYRTNIGWFNGSSTTATVTFTVHQILGSVLGTNTFTVAPGAQAQVALSDLFPEVQPVESIYVTFTTTGAPLYVYASVVDNVNGDAVFIPSQPN